MKDLFVRRVYTHSNGISITVNIDYVKKQISLVDKEGMPKHWLFAERTPEYLNGWRMILIAMDWTVEQIKKEFDDIGEKELEDFVKLYQSLDKPLKKGKGEN